MCHHGSFREYDRNKSFLIVKRQVYNPRLPRGVFLLHDIITGRLRLPTIIAVSYHVVFNGVLRPEEAISRDYLLIASRKIRNSKSNSERTTSSECLLRLVSRWDNICKRVSNEHFAVIRVWTSFYELRRNIT